jgi:hypothetical protein
MDLLGNDISIDDIVGAKVPDDPDYALESILAEYGEEELGAPDLRPEAQSPAHPIEAMEEGDGIETAELSSYADDEGDSYEIPAPIPAAPAPQADGDEDEDVRIYRIGDILVESADGGEGSGETPGAHDGEPSVPPRAPRPPRAEPPQAQGLGQKLSAGVLSALALLAMKKQQRVKADAVPGQKPEEDEGPEMDAESASKYYAGHIKSLRLRVRLSVLLCIILAWISFGLPVAGALGSSVTVASLMCLILELSVVMLGLDIFTAGITSLLRLEPSIWSLVSVSCIASALDAAVTAAVGDSTLGLPFCAVSAISMAFAMAGSLQNCRGMRLSLRALALSRDPYAVTAESGVAEDGVTLLKSKRGAAGYLRRCEEPDCAESIYGYLAPFLLVGALLLSLIATAVSKQWSSFFRVLAAITAPAAPFAAFLAFPLPFFIVSRRIFQSGAAIAGWAGLRDIGKSRHIVVTDRDIFPPGTLSVESIRILEGTWPEKVISATGSIICASGSGLAPLFTELMRRNNCTMQRVEDFCCHEGGGLTALIGGEEVLCGNAGFMHLMSIRLPQKLASKSSVFVSINGVLAGIFTIKYVPITSVQDALASLLHTRRDPIFAIRDFNITPLMIRQKFRMPTDGFDFPTFARRYEISAAEPSPQSLISAIISREGLGPVVEVSDRGRKLYIAAALSTVLAVLCTLVGMTLMFALCLSGSFDSATVGNLMTYMFLWLVPTIILAFGLGR